MVQDIIKTMANKNINLSISDGLIERIAQAGYDPVYGARPLRHMLQDKIENSLAKKMLSGDIKPGASVELNEENTEV